MFRGEMGFIGGIKPDDPSKTREGGKKGKEELSPIDSQGLYDSIVEKKGAGIMDGSFFNGIEQGIRLNGTHIASLEINQDYLRSRVCNGQELPHSAIMVQLEKIGGEAEKLSWEELEPELKNGIVEKLGLE
jgi:hypothetical protein